MLTKKIACLSTKVDQYLIVLMQTEKWLHIKFKILINIVDDWGKQNWCTTGDKSGDPVCN